VHYFIFNLVFGADPEPDPDEVVVVVDEDDHPKT
jgi:hypothetical protein